MFEYVPPAHAEQLREPAAEKEPAPQLSQPDSPVPEYLPASAARRCGYAARVLEGS